MRDEWFAERLITFNKDHWPYEYNYWRERNWL
jgi:hypothetical protein